jgi:hypothetical protein
MRNFHLVEKGERCFGRVECITDFGSSGWERESSRSPI